MSFEDSDRYVAGCYLLETAHREDPRPGPTPELSWAMHYHERLASRLAELAPDAPEEVCLAARGRLSRGWYRLREHYPAGHDGHQLWRQDAAHFHAGEVIALLGGVGYGRPELERVAALIEHRADPGDPGVQAYYDAIGVTFFRLELPAFARDHGDDDVADVARDHWRRMSQTARATVRAAAAEWPQRLRELLPEVDGAS